MRPRPGPRIPPPPRIDVPLVNVIKYLMRSDGPFVEEFMPKSMFEHLGTLSYVSSRLVDLFRLRVQQGKPHDHANFHKVRKALKRLFSPKSKITEIIEYMYDGNSETLLDELLEVYIIHIRKSLLASIIRIVAPRLGDVMLTNDDESATIRHGGPLSANGGNLYCVERDEKVMGRTTLWMYGPWDSSTDVIRGSLFPGKSPAEMLDLGKDIVHALSSSTPHELGQICVAALNTLDSAWTSIQTVAVTIPQDLKAPLAAGGATLEAAERAPPHQRATEASCVLNVFDA